jgi:ribonuclease HI
MSYNASDYGFTDQSGEPPAPVAPKPTADQEPVEIFTDGSCLGNPGPGGFAALIYDHGQRRVVDGEAPQTTNSRMELMAAIIGLELVVEPSFIKLYSDSAYVIDGISIWLSGWKKRNWRTYKGARVKNVDLWKRLEAAAARHLVHWHHVSGHSGHPENDHVDLLARHRATLAKAKAEGIVTP